MAKKQKDTRGNYLVALYNLHLPEGEISLEDKKRLAKIVSEHPYEQTNVPDLDSYWESPRASVYTQNPPDGILFQDTPNTPVLRGLKNMYKSDKAWWNSDDFKKFLRDYRHLRQCIESYIEGENYGKFQQNDIVWLHRTLQRVIRYTVYVKPYPHLSMTPLARLEHFDEPYDSDIFDSSMGRVMTPDSTIDIDFHTPFISLRLGPDTLPSDQILNLAYLELINVINDHKAFHRCEAKKTSKKEPCPNIFSPEKKRGPTQRFCSGRCRRRWHEFEERQASKNRK